MAISPVRLNHAVLLVADLDRSLRFYTDVFGIRSSCSPPTASPPSGARPRRNRK